MVTEKRKMSADLCQEIGIKKSVGDVTSGLRRPLKADLAFHTYAQSEYPQKLLNRSIYRAVVY